MKRLAVNPFRVNLFQMIMRLANALQKIPARTTPPPFRLMQIGSLFWQSRALYVAVKLGVADTIGDSSKGAGRNNIVTTEGVPGPSMQGAFRR